MRALWIFLLTSMAPMAIRGHFEFNNVVCLVRDRMFMDMDHDILLDKLPVQHLNNLVQSIIPDGRYMMNSTWMVAGIPRTDVILYFTKS